MLDAGTLRRRLKAFPASRIEARAWAADRWQSVQLTPTPQHFGGCRWSFRCPTCGRQARKLFLPPAASSFACRNCHSIRYVSQVLRKSDRWRRRAAKLYRRAGSSSDADLHQKPRGMHWSRFHALIDEAEGLETRAFLRDTAPFLASIGHPLPADVAAAVR